MTIRSGIEKITPAKAIGWLNDPTAVNPRGRLNKLRVNAYADQMLKDQWELTGEPLQFNSDGVLMNGWHRLNALLLASETVPGISFKSLVVRGVEPKASRFMDSGLNRSIADNLAASGYAGRVSQVSATAKFVLAWEKGIAHSNSASTISISRSDIIDFATKNFEEISEAITAADTIYSAIGGSLTAWSAFFYRIFYGDFDQTLAKEFYKGVVTGADLSAGDPRLACRNWFITSKATRRRNIPNVGPQLSLQIITRAWNHYVSGETRTRIMQSQKRGAPIPQPSSLTSVS